MLLQIMCKPTTGPHASTFALEREGMLIAQASSEHRMEPQQHMYQPRY